MKTSMNASVTVVKFARHQRTVTTLPALSAVSAVRVSSQSPAVKPPAQVDRYTVNLCKKNCTVYKNSVRVTLWLKI